ncbi:MAG: hypothetical protein HYV94_17170 [Candidatus Rokubacteria bacterium]|nr:hypothetical protein [Candidatus Rokubacteria bacterium]
MSEHGASYLLYLASDAVVDGCFPVLDALGDEIDELEEAVVGGAAPHRMHRIFALKRVLVQLRKIVSPQREVYNGLSRRDYPHIDPRATVYFRDVASSRTVRKAQKAERAARGIPGEGVLRRARYVEKGVCPAYALDSGYAVTTPRGRGDPSRGAGGLRPHREDSPLRVPSTR